MKRKATLKIWMDKKSELRWHVIATNGRKLCNPGEGYKRMAGLVKDLVLVFGEKCPAHLNIKFSSQKLALEFFPA